MHVNIYCIRYFVNKVIMIVALVYRFIIIYELRIDVNMR